MINIIAIEREVLLVTTENRFCDLTHLGGFQLSIGDLLRLAFGAASSIRTISASTPPFWQLNSPMH
jgi:hypothetical protein